MRNLDELQERIDWYRIQIENMKQNDAKFPDDPIHENDIRHYQGAIRYLERRVREISGDSE